MGSSYVCNANGKDAKFAATFGITVDTSGDLYVCDVACVRKITANRDVTIFAGLANATGYADGTGGAHPIYTPHAIAVNENGDVFIGEWFNKVIRKISRTGVVSVLAGHPGMTGHKDGTGDNARFDAITAMAFGPDGNLYVSELNCVRRVSQSGTVTTLSGDPVDSGAVDGPVSRAKFNNITGIAVGIDGTIYVSDTNNYAIRKISPDGNVVTIAGKLGQRDVLDGTGADARFFRPTSLGIALDGTLYVEDLCTIRKITSDCKVTTVTGKLGANFSRDGVRENATLAPVNTLAVDRQQNVFFVEDFRVRMMTPDGTVTTIGGMGTNPNSGMLDARLLIGIGLDAQFRGADSITIDRKGRLYFTDYGRGWIWKATTPMTEMPSPLVNISSRALAGTGNNVTIGGFVVTGNTAKKFLVRAVGPSLSRYGINQSDVMADPMIELYDSQHGNTVLATNDDWQNSSNASEIVSVSEQVGAALLSSDDRASSALLQVLHPGAYSFIARGKADSTGIVLLEVYDAETTSQNATLSNISTRARASAGNGVTIGGFVVGGTLPKVLLIRAVGPTLTQYGLPASEVLQDPMIEVHAMQQGDRVIASNDNWRDSANASEVIGAGERIGAAPLSTNDVTSSAMLLTVPPGVYSFIAKGKGETSGLVLVEVYDVD